MEAEEEADIMEQEEEEQKFIAGAAASQPIHKYKKQKKVQCNARIDELSKPRKWLVLALWKEHACIFEPPRMERIKQKIQEEFCMTPEETERYMESIKKKEDKKRRTKEKMKEARKEKQLAKEEAYCLFRKFLKKAMMFACTNVAPPLVSPMLRYMSESILVLLSEIHGVSAPKRCNRTNLGQFLLGLSDWAAIFLAHLYYEVDVDENIEIERLKELERITAEEEAAKKGEEEKESAGKGKEESKKDEKAKKGQSLEKQKEGSKVGFQDDTEGEGIESDAMGVTTESITDAEEDLLMDVE